jgi:2-hydroxychromene-2-carboxylate isomerase
MRRWASLASVLADVEQAVADSPLKIDFYFDFASPYAWLISDRLEQLAARHQREVVSRPVLLFAIFKAVGLPPPMDTEAKRKYMLRDMERSARYYGVPYRHPANFPAISPVPGRLFYGLAEQDSAQAKAFAKEALRAHFVDGRDITKPDVVAEIAGQAGIPASSVEAALTGERGKSLLRESVEEATRRGVIGSPFVVVDGEPFFGADRLDHIEWWLKSPEPKAL